MTTFDVLATPALDVRPEGAERVRRLLDDGAATVLVLGAPGFGKTRILGHVESWCADRGLSFARYPFGADDRSRRSGGSAVGGRGGPGELGDADRPRPDVLLVDDADHLPAGELDALVARPPGSSRLVVTARPGTGVEALAAQGYGTHTVRLEPWSADEVTAAVEQLAAGGPGPGTPELGDGVDRVLDLTGGLPWLVAEVLLAGPDALNDTTRPGHPNRPEREVLRAVGRLPDLLAEAVLALGVGYPLDRPPVPAPLAHLTPAELPDLFDGLTTAGLLTIDGRLPTLVGRTVLAHMPRHRIRPYLDAVVDDLLSAGVDVAPLAEGLVAAGVHDPRLSAAVEQCADSHLAAEPGLSAQKYTAALLAGGDPERLVVKRAEALARSGDLDGAHAVLAAPAAGSPSSAERVRVSATLAVLAGQAPQAATLGRWAVRHEVVRPGDDAAATVAYVLYGAGDRALADGLLTSDPASAPALAEPRMRTVAEAVRLSLGRDPWAALPMLVQAAGGRLSGHRPRLLPEVPAALAALVSLHSGDLAMADSVLAPRPAATGAPDTAADRSRRAALRAWTSMLAGRYADAHDELAAIDPGAARDQPWVWGLRVGLARRQDDIPALARCWVQARGMLVGHPVDLYSLLPLGEIGLAAARMGEPDLAAPAWDQATALLDALGRPPLWAPAFHWYGVQAAILTDRPAAMAPHASALVAASAASPLAATLSKAGRAWLAVLARDVDPVAVQAAARALAEVGQTWEGARLAGHGAARAQDRKDAAALLECARDLQAPLQAVGSGGGSAHPTPAETKAGVVPLSAREREVVELVLSGMTYRQVGESLYLSAKTVEHHMARIRRRSGATSRSDLLGRLSITIG